MHSQENQNDNNAMPRPKFRKPATRGWILLFLGLLLLGGLFLGGWKGWQIYKQARLVQQDTAQMRSMLSAPGTRLARIKAAGPALATLRQDFLTLKGQTEPFLWLGPRLSWVPKYGGDLASAQDLMNMADALLATADVSYQAVSPAFAGSSSSSLDPAQLTEVLLKAQPHFIEAQRQLVQAQLFRDRLAIDSLTPEVRTLILKDIDPLLPLAREGLSMAEELPRLLGATSEGPKTYLILVENEDERRPTGGYISAAGTLRVDRGHIGDMNLQDIYSFDNWIKPYPVAPWQLQTYMHIPVLTLRDTSWFTDFPTAAAYARSLYAYYADAQPVNGVIEFDQQMLVEILGVTGPITLAGVPYPINVDNLKAYMIASKTPPANAPPGWNRKDFMGPVAKAVMDKIIGGDIPAEKLFTFLLQVLDERHLLLQLDSPTMTDMLAKYRWDGAVRPQQGDFLMAVDANVGYNKTNKVVQSNMVYDVDLTRPAAPVGLLTVVHKNNANPVICNQYRHDPLPTEWYYPITDCYWNYMQIYKASGTKLLDATPQFVPASWTIGGKDVPARVDDLLNDGINGVQAFGTFQVVPGGESVSTSFRFALPASLLQSGTNQSIYHLLVQKQAGSLAVPIIIRVHLPNRASVQSAPAGAVVQGNNILYQTELRTDVEFEIVFHVP